MALNIKDLDLEGALEVAESISLSSDNHVKKDGIVLHKGNDGYDRKSSLLDPYKVGEEVILLSEEQATNFHSELIDSTKTYRIADVVIIPDVGIDDRTRYLSYMTMNPTQAEIYLSLGIGKLVAVKKTDLERVFANRDACEK